MRKVVLILITIIILSSCNTNKKIRLTDCEHVSGWCKEIREVAVKSWKYAQLSKNVYNKPFKFDTDKYFEKIEDYEKNQINFFASLYREKSNGIYVFVFRGTDSPKDFRTGNNPFRQQQNQFALEVYDKAKNKFNIDSCVVAGHSLGGGISIHISLNRKKATAFSFNGSPVFRNIENVENQRFSIVEHGEVLKFTRIFGREADQLYTSIGCSKGNTIEQHDMKSLAICLTQIATIESSEATESLILNGIIQLR